MLPLVVCALALLAGSFILASRPGLAWLGATVVGLSLGGFFSLCLLLAVDLGHETHQVAGFAGMMLGCGYAIAALAPLALGVARDAAGSFQTALWLMVAIAAALLGFLIAARSLLTPSTTALEDELSGASPPWEPESARSRTP
jgi:CP family cyanate transporter-like MFS transporter